MSLTNVYFVPHPPLVLKEIGGHDVQSVSDTVDALSKIAQEIKDCQPELIIFISPHGISFNNGTCFQYAKQLSGNFEMFGAPDIQYTKNIDMAFTKSLERKLESHDLISVLLDADLAKGYKRKLNLDHGAMVPMYFIDQAYSSYDVVHITPGFTDLVENYKIGKLISEQVDLSSKKVVLICSGDLSHALKNSGPYAFHKNGPIFDQLVQTAVVEKNPLTLMDLEESFIESAAQCGLRSILMGFGAMDGKIYDSELLSYEGPFGVGYMVGKLKAKASGPSVLEEIKKSTERAYLEKTGKESLYVSLARYALEYNIKHGKKMTSNAFVDYMINVSQPVSTNEEILGFLDQISSMSHGCFVSIHKNHHLRGCMGTISAATENLYEEIIYNAMIASTEDPRFDPITENELHQLEINVDVLMPLEKVNSFDDFDVVKFGMVVEKGSKRGLLLPNLDGVNTVKEQYRICLEKAGIYRDQDVQLYRFEVIRHK